MFKKKKRDESVAIREIRPYYMKKDVVFSCNLSKEEMNDILKKILIIINLNDKEKALRCYLDLLTFYGTNSVNFILFHAKVGEKKIPLRDTQEFRDFSKFMDSKDIVGYNAIIGLSSMYPKTTPEERKQAAIYSKDYVVCDTKPDFSSVVFLGYNYKPLLKVYQEINHAIIYDQVDLLIKNISFIIQRDCYHFLFLEYPELQKYVPANNEEMKVYQRKRVK